MPSPPNTKDEPIPRSAQQQSSTTTGETQEQYCQELDQMTEIWGTQGFPAADPLPPETTPPDQAIPQPCTSHPENCIICLCPLTTPSILHPCLHTGFDFPCLLSWLETVHAQTNNLDALNCPFCRRPILIIQHKSSPSSSSLEDYVVADNFWGYRGSEGEEGEETWETEFGGLGWPLDVDREFIDPSWEITVADARAGSSAIEEGLEMNDRDDHATGTLHIELEPVRPGLYQIRGRGNAIAEGMMPDLRFGDYVTDEEFEHAGGIEYVLGLLEQMAVRDAMREIDEDAGDEIDVENGMGRLLDRRDRGRGRRRVGGRGRRRRTSGEGVGRESHGLDEGNQPLFTPQTTLSDGWHVLESHLLSTSPQATEESESSIARDFPQVTRTEGEVQAQRDGA